jgi:hypothetical protein
MKSGIISARARRLRILVDGQPRMFRDVEAIAYEAAHFLKIASEYKERVEIVVRSTGQHIKIT